MGENGDRTSEEYYIKKVYFQTVCLGVALHLTYILLFFGLSMILPALYNVASVIFYLLMLKAVKKGWFKGAVSAIHIEVCCFVVVSAVSAGWETGFPMYLLAMGSLIYFCPFKRRWIPYLFSFIEVATYIVFRIALNGVKPLYAIEADYIMVFNLLNVTACFILITYVGFLTDVSAKVTRKELENANESLSERADYDELTKLLTRYAFEQRFKSATGKTAAFLMGDIDHFKRANDRYGHNCGDYVLKETARLLKSLCKTDASVCRWGGEEFLILLPDLDLEKGRAEAETLRKAVEDCPYEYQGKRIKITMTFGVFACRVESGNESELRQIVNAADERLYYGKNHGRNQVVWADKQ